MLIFLGIIIFCLVCCCVAVTLLGIKEDIETSEYEDFTDYYDVWN